MIADPIGGNGYSILKRSDNRIIYATRKNWLCHAVPGKIITAKGNSIYGLISGKSNIRGYLTWYEQSSNQINYQCKGNKDTYSVCENSIAGKTILSRKIISLKTGEWEDHGESIVIENENLEYKRYYQNHRKVDYDEFKKI